MNVNDAIKIVDAIPNHEHIVLFYKIGDPVSQRVIQLSGGFTCKQLHALATVMEYKPDHWE